MYDQQTIEQMSRDAALQAAEESREPFIVWPEDLDNIPPFPFPFLGDYCPDNWEPVTLTEGRGVYFGDNPPHGAYFVDASGFGQPGEGGALTIGEFVELLEPGFGYALVKTGQFQVKVAKYERTQQ